MENDWPGFEGQAGGGKREGGSQFNGRAGRLLYVILLGRHSRSLSLLLLAALRGSDDAASGESRETSD